MMLSLRLDVIQRILSAFVTNEIEEDKDKSIPNSSPPPPPQRRSSSSASSFGFSLSPPITSLPDCISSLDIHLTLDNFLACSWPNSSNLYGVAFFQDLMKLDIRLTDHPSAARGVQQQQHHHQQQQQQQQVEVQQTSSSLELESIEGNIENFDVYVREWKVMKPKKVSSSSSSSSSKLGSQCLSVADIVSLFDPIYKLAHASKVVLKYEEENQEMTSFGNSFRKFSTETVHLRHNSQTTFISSAPSVSLRDKLVFTPSILSFRANHSAFMPPHSSLPTGHSLKRASTHALDLLSRPFHSQLPQIGKRASSSSSSFRGFNSLGDMPTKMWDLKIVDIRLLWTISLRDMLANYAARCSDIFKRTPTKSSPLEHSFSHDDMTHGNSNSNRNFQRSVSMDESILPSRSSSSLISTPKSMIEKPFHGSPVPSSSSDPPVDDDTDLEHVLAINLPTNMRNRAMTKRQSGEIDLATYYLHSQQENFMGTHSPLLENSSSNASTSLLTATQSKRKRRGNRRLSLRDMNLNVDDSLAPETPEEVFDTSSSPSSSSIFTYPTPPKPTLASAAASSRLFNRSSSVDNSLLTSTSSSPMSTGDGGGLPRHTNTAAAAGDEIKNKNFRNYFQNFFSIELQDPQVNILDEKTQSTMLIVIDGSSTLIGKKHNGATVTVQGLGDQEKESPKRKVNVRLKMENVNAYTITTSNESMSLMNIVHWKALDHTEIGKYKTHYHRHRHQRTSTNEKFVNANDFFLTKEMETLSTTPLTEAKFSPSVNRPAGMTSSGNGNGNVNGLRNAINNFEMIAVYTYYEDLTEEEAAAMYTHRTREELMNSFLLDLPQVCLKVDSLQFSILLNTIRNVLLAPPPAQVEESNGTPEEDLEMEAKRGVIQMEPSDGVSPSLDNRYGRAQIKEIVEKNLLTLSENEFCTAQSIEYFVGRGTWQMCSPNSDDVLLEVGFMGLFGSHSFHEDRFS
jgi:hypothetical protein